MPVELCMGDFLYYYESEEEASKDRGSHHDAVIYLHHLANKCFYDPLSATNRHCATVIFKK